MYEKVFTINDFTACVWYKPIESTGYWSNFSERWDINYSSILTELIQQAGRWCECFASDLFISWQTVEKRLVSREIENESFLFGFRQYGVDHDRFIFSRFNQDEFTQEYRTIYRLDIELMEDEVKMSLYRVK